MPSKKIINFAETKATVSMKKTHKKSQIIHCCLDKKPGNGTRVSDNVIKLKTVTAAERRELRITSYKYLLP